MKAYCVTDLACRPPRQDLRCDWRVENMGPFESKKVDSGSVSMVADIECNQFHTLIMVGD